MELSELIITTNGILCKPSYIDHPRSPVLELILAEVMGVKDVNGELQFKLRK